MEDFIYEEYIPGGLYYNKSTKRLHGKRGGGGGIEDWYYTLDKSKSIKRVYLQKVETQFNSATGKFKYGFYFKGKTISKKTYSKKLKSWNKNLKPLKFYKLTERNIKKHIKYTIKKKHKRLLVLFLCVKFLSYSKVFDDVVHIFVAATREVDKH